MPGKGSDKDNGNKTPVPGLAEETATRSAAAPTSAPAQPTPAPARPKRPAASQASSQDGNAFDRFKAEMDSLVNEEEAKQPGSGEALASPDELASRIRPTDRQPELAVGGDADMLKILSDQAGLKYVSLGSYSKQDIPKLLPHIPSEIARSYKVFPIEMREGGTIVIAISDPLNVRIVDDLRLFLVDPERNIHNVEAVVASEEEIMDYINLFYGVGDVTLEKMVEDFESEDTSSGLENNEGYLDLSDLDKISREGPVIKFCNLLLLQAIKDRASDLHIEPFSNSIRIRYRVDGVLREIPSPPKSWQAGILSRMKVMAGLDIAEMRRPQDGRLKLTFEGREIDMRLSTLPVIHGEGIVMRLLDKTMMMLGIRQVGMTPEVLEKFMKLVERPNGVLLVTGPTGSGKTTTLYAAINEINDPTEKIITTEDPVEYQVEGLVQVNINAGVGLTFARCLRAILRQDPDTILVGEIRDVETAQIAIQAALTGHFVFSTLHTNSAAATITRLIDMGVEPFLITSTLAGIVGQRLVRMICPNCRKPYRPTVEELADFGTTPEEVADITFWKGEGCEECAHTGYKGRIGIYELLEATDEVKYLILDRASTDEIHAKGLEQGMKTMRQDGWLKICLGVTTFDEVAKHTPKESPTLIRQEMETVIHDTAETGAVDMQQILQPPQAPAQAPQVSMSSIATPWEGEAAAMARNVGDSQRVEEPPKERKLPDMPEMPSV